MELAQHATPIYTFDPKPVLPSINFQRWLTMSRGEGEEGEGAGWGGGIAAVFIIYKTKACIYQALSSVNNTRQQRVFVL